MQADTMLRTFTTASPAVRECRPAAPEQPQPDALRIRGELAANAEKHVAMDGQPLLHVIVHASGWELTAARDAVRLTGAVQVIRVLHDDDAEAA